MRIRVLRRHHEGSRCARGSPSSASPERTTRRPTCPSYNACPDLPSHHQDASFTTSAALYGRTVASRHRRVPVRQAVRMTGIDLLKVPDAQRCSHDSAIHRPRARSSRVQHVARRQPAACPTEPAKPIETVLGQTPVEDGAKSLERLAALGRLRGPDGLDHADDILAGDGVQRRCPSALRTLQPRSGCMNTRALRRPGTAA